VIYYLTAARQAGAMAYFLQHAGKALAKRMHLIAYEEIFAPGTSLQLPRGTYIFTCLDKGLGSRHPPSPLRKAAIELHARLVELHGPGKVLNHPENYLRRYELLRALHAGGINQFAVCRPDETPARFPVYLRDTVGSEEIEPELIYSAAGYQAARALEPLGRERMAIEFCDTADGSELYRKYGAFVIGGEVVPRHVFFSRRWFIKSADLTAPELVREELAYLEQNPHAEALRLACRMAQIGYGRVDYALLDGRPQIWEINQTPTVSTPPPGEIDLRKAVHQRFAELLSSALDRLEST
jgi:hypothetical protein